MKRLLAILVLAAGVLIATASGVFTGANALADSLQTQGLGFSNPQTANPGTSANIGSGLQGSSGYSPGASSGSAAQLLSQASPTSGDFSVSGIRGQGDYQPPSQHSGAWLPVAFFITLAVVILLGFYRLFASRVATI